MSLTSYRAAPPRDQGKQYARPRCAGQVLLKRIYTVANPIARQFQKLQPHPLEDPQPRPVGASKCEIRRPRIKFYLRREMLETFQRPPRMIPRRDDNHVANIFRPQQFDGELRVLARRPRLAFELDCARRNTGLDQKPPVDFIVTLATDDDARRGLRLEQ